MNEQVQRYQLAHLAPNVDWVDRHCSLQRMPRRFPPPSVSSESSGSVVTAVGRVRWTGVGISFESAAYVALAVIGVFIFAVGPGGDAHAYWAARGYSGTVDERDAFLYTPPFLLALAPFQILPWEVFHALMLAVQLTALAWLTGPILAVLVLLPGPYSPVFTDLWWGNIHVLTAAVVVAGFRHSTWWAILPFGKVLPGVAMLWNGPRPMIFAAVVTLASLLAVPHLWADWLAVMVSSSYASWYVIPRGIIAAGIVLVGRWRGWRWTVPLAVTLAQPVLWYSSFAILLGWVWLLRESVGVQLRDPEHGREAGRRVDGGRAARQRPETQLDRV